VIDVKIEKLEILMNICKIPIAVTICMLLLVRKLVIFSLNIFLCLLECRDVPCSITSKRCISSSVIEIWKKAGFGDFILKGATVREKILKLDQKYKKIRKLRSLNWDSSQDRFEKMQLDFIEENNCLFDISVPNIEDKIASVRLRSKNAKDEDLLFYKDQKGERKQYISEEFDKNYQEAMINKEQRYQRLLKIQETEKQKSNTYFAPPEMHEQENSFEYENSEPESDIEPSSEEDSDKENIQNISKPKVFIHISPEELIECTTAADARYNVGIRPQTSIVAAICKKGGVNLDDINLSRSTVHRKRFEQIE